MTRASWRPHVVVVRAGFCGLAAAYKFGQRGIRIPVLECDEDIGGLVGNFLVGGTRVEKFYHHWFTNDVHVMRFIQELGQADRVLRRPSRAGIYYAHDFFNLSTPVDLTTLLAVAAARPRPARAVGAARASRAGLVQSQRSDGCGLAAGIGR